MSISVTDEQRAFVDRLVASGKYASASEVIRDLLRRHAAEKALEELIFEGLRSPIVGTGDDVTRWLTDRRSGDQPRIA